LDEIAKKEKKILNYVNGVGVVALGATHSNYGY